MDLLNISVFLDFPLFTELYKEIKTNNINNEQYAITEGSKTINCFDFTYSGIIFTILPSNIFHKNYDFEIGISIANHEEYIASYNKAVEKKLRPKMNTLNNPFFILECIHGPFFFINDMRASQIESIDKIKITVHTNDYTNIKRTVSIIDKKISKKLIIRKSLLGYKIEEITFTTSLGKCLGNNGRFLSLNSICFNQELRPTTAST